MPAALALSPLGYLPPTSLAQGRRPLTSEPLPDTTESYQPAPMASRIPLAIQDILHASPEAMSSQEGSCLDISALWVEPLRQHGVPGRLSLTDSAQGHGDVRLQDGQTIFHDKFHAYLTVPDPTGERIIDPTWKQFVADKEAAAHLPDVLSGTVDELKQVYSSLQPQLQLETHGHDPLQGRYEPSSLVELIYGSGRHQDLRQVLTP